VDVSGKFPELKRKPGLTTWTPTVDRSINTTFASYDAFINTLSPADASSAESKMTEGHWPPSDPEELGLTRWFAALRLTCESKLNWDRSLRIYSHLQDTGAFFVAVLRKKQTPGSLQSRVD
jgi:multisite-specific tRNA:(cytosine-C5)-methyltransferase